MKDFFTSEALIASETRRNEMRRDERERAEKRIIVSYTAGRCSPAPEDHPADLSDAPRQQPQKRERESLQSCCCALPGFARQPTRKKEKQAGEVTPRPDEKETSTTKDELERARGGRKKQAAGSGIMHVRVKKAAGPLEEVVRCPMSDRASAPKPSRASPHR